MAHAEHTHVNGTSFLDVVVLPFQIVWNALTSIAEANHAAREISRLSAKSDAELAQMHLRREDIARHVMGF